MKTRNLGVAWVVSLLIVLLGSSREVGAQADPFYKGKTIRIYVGSTAGGFYDRWARLFARYMANTFPAIPKSSRRTKFARDGGGFDLDELFSHLLPFQENRVFANSAMHANEEINILMAE